ncbi:hypothetical protein [Streptomyces chattanoogensis]|uniref:hypothetical protein n=1 Tax=Streptomyces chattanoogensis TaxID=66876 RepID=UPI0036B0CB42
MQILARDDAPQVRTATSLPPQLSEDERAVIDYTVSTSGDFEPYSRSGRQPRPWTTTCHDPDALSGKGSSEPHSLPSGTIRSTWLGPVSVTSASFSHPAASDG